MPVAQLLGESMTTETKGIGVIGALGVVFVALKLMGHIDWSWWLVLLPFYWWMGLFAVLMTGFYLVGMLRFFGSLFK